MPSMEIFISYSSKDSEIARGIRDNLSRFCGFSIFLAEISIGVGKKFTDEILENLKNTDVVIAVISDTFNKSAYANQEIGAALVLNKPILPLSIDGCTPPGFLSVIQAAPLNFEKAFQFTLTIPFIVSEKSDEFASKVAASFVIALKNTNDFHEANIIMGLMTKYELFSVEQIDEILRIIEERRVLRDAFNKPNFVEYLANLKSKRRENDAT